jgi:hypothetical protein
MEPEKNENEKENQEEKTTKPTENLATMVDRLEKANIEAKEILARQEELAARNLLGGRTDNPNTEKKVEEVTPEKISKDMEKLGW